MSFIHLEKWTSPCDDVEPNEPVGKVKIMIKDKEDIDTDEQRLLLLYGNPKRFDELKDDLTLADYDIQNGIYYLPNLTYQMTAVD